MNEKRRKAYRYLLYHAMLDIRPIAWTHFSIFRSINPFKWQASLRQIRRAGIVADWLHNLALFSALDYEHFEEEWFWRDFDSYNARHPELQLSDYRDVFERELIGSDAASE
ncbi:MAG TPA: hypothetical protein VGN42_24835 [Pirellulales bacterium]|jgi:hypothetical protein|nr:hypothetical protein [Pirellulales bacterium]